MPKQDRRAVQVPTPSYEALSFLQAEVQLLMREQNVTYILSKTAMSNILKVLITDADPKRVVKLLKYGADVVIK